MGYIPKCHWPICQQGSRQNGQSRIFGARDTHFPCQGSLTSNFQLIHESDCGCGNGQTSITDPNGLRTVAHITGKIGNSNRKYQSSRVADRSELCQQSASCGPQDLGHAVNQQNLRCVYFRQILYHAHLTMPLPPVRQMADLEPQTHESPRKAWPSTITGLNADYA